jgi:hypothetical protein
LKSGWARCASRSGTCSRNGGAQRTLALYERRRFSRMLSGERLRRLIVPPSESAPLSGVWPLVSSIWSNIVPVRLFMLVDRPRAPWLVSGDPSRVIVFRPGPTPRTVKPSTRFSSLRLPATPGSRIATSPAFMFGRLPNESIATMLFTFSALRWAVMAAAPPSRSPVTLNASS